ncbi:unnamed protein product [Didymodactylos carnosus]|uniref:Uncharacterized protein n=1 Tax=Didymodactylos carnosus TaxID=1234261 RepID=A0A814VF50_9BILA|nr:unnamed protein product [Didymodactylos carnosus]CAF1187334.1 unnamed protein product [Didymodactylos carnosus]CAF3793072.1 unnamed protein product [Didymodactylos carnosus]CAF3951598.1 unnamed protein product [Didymodactylos carnosus]
MNSSVWYDDVFNDNDNIKAYTNYYLKHHNLRRRSSKLHRHDSLRRSMSSEDLTNLDEHENKSKLSVAKTIKEGSSLNSLVLQVNRDAICGNLHEYWFDRNQLSQNLRPSLIRLLAGDDDITNGDQCNNYATSTENIIKPLFFHCKRGAKFRRPGICKIIDKVQYNEQTQFVCDLAKLVIMEINLKSL